MIINERERKEKTERERENKMMVKVHVLKGMRTRKNGNKKQTGMNENNNEERRNFLLAPTASFLISTHQHLPHLFSYPFVSFYREKEKKIEKKRRRKRWGRVLKREEERMWRKK